MRVFQANSAILTVACPGGTVLLGGGGFAGGVLVAIRSSFPATSAVTGLTVGTPPTDGATANGWSAIFNAADGDNRVFAVCSP